MRQTRRMPDAAIQDLATELRVLHKALLQVGRVDYEASHGPVEGATQLWHLLIHDPAFAWLRSLSELMADLDELLEGSQPALDEEGAIRGELEHLFSPAGGQLWLSLTAFI